jgi:hypothetical protein
VLVLSASASARHRAAAAAAAFFRNCIAYFERPNS